MLTLSITVLTLSKWITLSGTSLRPIKNYAKKKAVDPAQQAFFVDKAIEEGKQCESLANLSSLWKNNQKQIDEIKVSNKEEFTRLQTAFADIKSSLQE